MQVAIAAAALADGDSVFAVFGGVAFVAMSAWVWLAVYRSAPRRAKRELRRARHVAIAAVPEGVAVRVIGRVRTIGAPLVSPLSGRACVHYRIVVLGLEPVKILDVAEARQPFVLEDDTGVALIEPASGIIAVTAQPVQKVDASVRQPGDAHRYAEARWNHTWPRKVQLHEFLLERDELAAVLGAATREPTSDASSAVEGYRDAPRTQLRFASSPAYPLRISNDASTVAPGTQPS